MAVENMLIRTGEPSKYDEFPYGTPCKVAKTIGDTFEVYVQISHDETSPCWERIGIFSSDTEQTIQEEIERVLAGRKAL